MNQELRNFVMAVLDDDSGISEVAWHELGHLLMAVGELELLTELSAQVDACDSRFFIK
jgi:hypothetical protein